VADVVGSRLTPYGWSRRAAPAVTMGSTTAFDGDDLYLDLESEAAAMMARE
jgi:hypothetical protein